MIRLTLNPNTEPEIHLFNKNEIVIGDESVSADLLISLPTHLHVHLKIVEKEGRYILINVNNDPFITLNGIPFGKKQLKSDDKIIIGQVEILFELLVVTEKKEEIPYEEPPAVSKSIEESSATLGFELPFEKELPLLKEEELNLTDLENYLTSIDRFSAQPKTHSEESKDNKKSSNTKDDYLKELEDDPKKQQPHFDPSEPSHLYQVWKLIIIFIFSFVSLGLVIATTAYFVVSDRTETQSLKVAQRMADISMALTHAQLHHQRPHNQNWSDIDFLKRNLQSILPNRPAYFLGVDSQGQFSFSPYSLRIYTSRDLSRFLLIAQPAPTLSQWVVPKAVILVDSTIMELRMIKDVRHLNRLLANQEPLEAINGKEITALIQQGELISLKELAEASKENDFAPPQALALKRAGSENLIYNAPRYRELGRTLMERAIELSKGKGTGREVALLKQELEALKVFNNLVLYADGSQSDALKMRQGIVTYASSHGLEFAYIVYDDNGKMLETQLLGNQKTQEIAFEDTHSSGELQTEKMIDPNHPIYIQLANLKKVRNQELSPLAQQIQKIVKLETHSPKDNFEKDFRALVTKFLITNAKFKKKIKTTIHKLANQYGEMPPSEFMKFVEAADFVTVLKKKESDPETTLHNFKPIEDGIIQATNWKDLDKKTEDACAWLTFENVPDPEDIIANQNQIRNLILEKLEKWVLTPDEPEDSANRLVHLKNILSHQKFITAEEKQFFLKAAKPAA